MHPIFKSILISHRFSPGAVSVCSIGRFFTATNASFLHQSLRWFSSSIPSSHETLRNAHPSASSKKYTSYSTFSDPQSSASFSDEHNEQSDSQCNVAMHLGGSDHGIVGERAVQILHLAIQRPEIFNDFVKTVWGRMDAFTDSHEIKQFFSSGQHDDILNWLQIQQLSQDSVKEARVTLGGLIISFMILNDMNNRVGQVAKQLQYPDATYWNEKIVSEISRECARQCLEEAASGRRHLFVAAFGLRGADTSPATRLSLADAFARTCRQRVREVHAPLDADAILSTSASATSATAALRFYVWWLNRSQLARVLLLAGTMVGMAQLIVTLLRKAGIFSSVPSPSVLDLPPTIDLPINMVDKMISSTPPISTSTSPSDQSQLASNTLESSSSQK